MCQIRRLTSSLLILWLLFLILPTHVLAEEMVLADGKCGANATWVLTEAGTLTISGAGDTSVFTGGKQPWFSYRDSIKNVVIEEGITALGSYAFRSFENLERIQFPNGLTRIGLSALSGCESLQAVTLPESLERMLGRNFEGCVKLTRITIPENVEYIGEYAFLNCSGLTEIRFEGDAPSITANSFYGVAATVYYPQNNETWTASERQHYGGSLKWVPYEVNREIEITVNSTAASVTEPEGGWKEGSNTFTVSGASPCVVAVSHDGGSTYVRLTAVATNAGNVYQFTADNITADSIIAVSVIGDVNGDGSITNADVTRLKAAYQNKVTLDSLKQLTADVNYSGDLTNADVTKLKAVYQNKTEFSW